MRKYHRASAGITLMLVGLNLCAQTPSAWKLFKSRGGWSISYPKQWRVSSCRSCKDPTAPGVFVDFFPPTMKTDEGWVMVEPLRDRPSRTAEDDWLSNISKTANVNAQISKEKMRVDRFPALKVRYRTKDGDEMESVYVAARSRTLVVDFNADQSGNRPGAPLETLPNYQSYRQMLDTLRITPQ
jgi:hypothetical protein